MQHEDEPDDEDDESGEPDDGVDEDVLEGGDEAEVVVRPDEVVEAAKPPPTFVKAKSSA